MNWLQIRLFGPYFSSFLTNSYGYYSQTSQNLVSNIQIFASALIVRQAAREQYFFDLLREKKTVVVPDCSLALFSFIWVVDMASMIIRCIGEEKTYNQEFNLSSDELVSYPRIIEVLAEITSEKIDVLSKSVDEINRERIPLPFPLNEHLVSSGSKLQQLLNFSYTPFKTGLRETLEYYHEVSRQQ